MITESVTNCVKDYCPCFQYKAYSEVCKNIALRLVLLCVLFAIMGNALSAEALLPDATPIYKSVAGHDLKLHIFNPPDFRPGDSRAAILFFLWGRLGYRFSAAVLSAVQSYCSAWGCGDIS